MPKIRVRPYGNVFRGIYQNSPPPYLPRCQTLPVVFSCLVCLACLSERVYWYYRGFDLDRYMNLSWKGLSSSLSRGSNPFEKNLILFPYPCDKFLLSTILNSNLWSRPSLGSCDRCRFRRGSYRMSSRIYCTRSGLSMVLDSSLAPKSRPHWVQTLVDFSTVMSCPRSLSLCKAGRYWNWDSLA